MQNVEPWLNRELVITIKMDGGNAMLVRDSDEPVRARNGSDAGRLQGSEYLTQLYYEHNCHDKIPEHYQIFGEWLYERHNIHYGCDCEEPCQRKYDGQVIDDVGPALGRYAEQPSYFQVFGVFDTDLNLWLSWDETCAMADELGFPTVPVVCRTWYDNENAFYRHFTTLCRRTVDAGHEGLVIRPRLPFHYGEFSERVTKFVRKHHVTEDDVHHSKREETPNVLVSDETPH